MDVQDFMNTLTWKTGFEIELLAPVGKSRKDLAIAIAKQSDGYVNRCFYPQSELSKVPDTPVFENLILGFEAFDSVGNLLAKCVDDLTLQADLNRHVPTRASWYRIISDDARLLRLVMAQCDPNSDQQTVLEPIAKLFKTQLTTEPPDLVRLADTLNAPIALAASLPGERERPCELITPPFIDDHQRQLEVLLAPALELGFTVPKEAAVHVHFDAEKLRHPRILANLIEVVSIHSQNFQRLVGTNPHCRRLGPQPDGVLTQVQKPGFTSLGWDNACAILQKQKMSKYCDFNFINLIQNIPGKSTFEVRILPGSMDSATIIRQTVLFEAVLNWCVMAPDSAALSAEIGRFIDELRLSPDDKSYWLQIASRKN